MGLPRLDTFAHQIVRSSAAIPSADAMWRMMQHPVADDFVIGTGETRSVRDFLDAAFRAAGLDWHEHVRFDARYLRPAEVDSLCADASKARRELGWAPTVGFDELVERMVAADLELARRERRAGA